MRIMMIANDTNFAWNLRREILKEFIDKGNQVILVAQILSFKNEFIKIGVKLINVETERQGKNPIHDMHLFFSYWKAIADENPDIVFTNNIKPNVYAGIVCQLKNIRYIPNITGLGTPVENPGKLQRLAIGMYKIGVRKASTIFFQNQDNIEFFKNNNMIHKNTKVVLLPGSGVNVETHPLLPWPENDKIHFLFVARIMKEKGIELFLAAAHKYADKNVIFDICGQCDDIHYKEILENDHSVMYHGLQKDLTPFYERCNCFLYPSYYPEGMSNVLLEAAASGRPVIAADRAGCRETLDHEITGYLVPVKDEKAVIEAVERFLFLDQEQMKQMGLAARLKVEKEFNRNTVVTLYIKEIEIAEKNIHCKKRKD